MTDAQDLPPVMAIRDEFEEWAAADNRRLDALEFEERAPDNNHYYDDDTTNHAYVGWCAAVAALSRRSLRAERDAVLEEALQPFAKIADWYSDSEDDHHEIWVDAHQKETRVTVGMCKAAARALKAEGI